MVGLAMKLEGHPQKQALLDALERQRLSRLEAFLDHLMNELYITGVRFWPVSPVAYS